MERLSGQIIRSRLPQGMKNLPIAVFDRIRSTNDEAGEQVAHAPLPRFVAVLAEEQFGGRGRRGRAWVSPQGRGLLLSVAFSYPHASGMRAEEWPLHAALAARDTIAGACGCDAKIKWPNDILVEGKKICGILAELGTGTYGRYLVLGFGINVNTGPGELPPEIESRATSIAAQTGESADRNELAARLIRRLYDDYVLAQGGMRFSDRREVWLSQCVTIGRPARISQGLQVYEGFVETIDDRGALQLIDRHGVRHSIVSGEVLETFEGDDRKDGDR